MLHFVILFCAYILISGSELLDSGTFKIEGKVEITTARDKDWIQNTKILVDGGQYVGHLK